MKEAALRQLFDEMRKENAEAHAETRRILRTENSDALDAVRTENEAAHAETRHLFSTLAENLFDEIRAVADGISVVDARLRRQDAELREETVTLSNRQTVMQVEHAKRERRVTALERLRK